MNSDTENRLRALEQGADSQQKALWTGNRGYYTRSSGTLTFAAFGTLHTAQTQAYADSAHGAAQGWLHLRAKGAGTGTLVLYAGNGAGQSVSQSFSLTTSYASFFIPFYFLLDKGWNTVEAVLASDTAVTVSSSSLQLFFTVVNTI